MVSRRFYKPSFYGRHSITVRLSVARLQSVGAGSDLETKRSALGSSLSVETYSYHRLLVAEFEPRFDNFRQVFKWKNGMSLNPRCYPRSAQQHRSMSWMGAQRRCIAPDEQSAVGGFLRRQTTAAGAGLGLETERSALGSFVSLVTHSYHRLHAAAEQHSPSACWARIRLL